MMTTTPEGEILAALQIHGNDISMVDGIYYIMYLPCDVFSKLRGKPIS